MTFEKWFEQNPNATIRQAWEAGWNEGVGPTGYIGPRHACEGPHCPAREHKTFEQLNAEARVICVIPDCRHAQFRHDKLGCTVDECKCMGFEPNL